MTSYLYIPCIKWTSRIFAFVNIQFVQNYFLRFYIFIICNFIYTSFRIHIYILQLLPTFCPMDDK